MVNWNTNRGGCRTEWTGGSPRALRGPGLPPIWGQVPEDLAGAAGFEPATTGFGDQRSGQTELRSCAGSGCEPDIAHSPYPVILDQGAWFEKALACARGIAIWGLSRFRREWISSPHLPPDPMFLTLATFQLRMNSPIISRTSRYSPTDMTGIQPATEVRGCLASITRPEPTPPRPTGRQRVKACARPKAGLAGNGREIENIAASPSFSGSNR